MTVKTLDNIVDILKVCLARENLTFSNGYWVAFFDKETKKGAKHLCQDERELAQFLATLIREE